MNQQILLKQRINRIFGTLCIPVAFLYCLAPILQGLSFLSLSPYLLEFVIPQMLYPLFNLLLALVALRCLQIPVSSALSVSRPRGEMLPWLGLFLGVVTAGNYLTEWMLALLERLGLSLPDVFSSHNPSDGGEAAWFFLVIVILPAFSEEILFRGLTGGGLREFHPGLAVTLSAFSFGMMHATVQQIPFAIAVGAVLGLVYVRTGNLLYPILFHFVNNAWACAVTYLQIFSDLRTAATVRFVGDLLFLAAGLVSLLWLMRKGRLSLKDLPRVCKGRDALSATLSSLGFWAFTLLFLLLTVAKVFS